MANWRGERYLHASITSVLSQTLRDIELLVADDASDDRSQDIVRAAMRLDSRVRLLSGVSNAGPSDARNRAIASARGEWVAIVDSDDLLHPRRLELLLEAASRFGADMVADDLAFFSNQPEAAGRSLLGALRLTDVMPVSPALLVESNNDPAHPNLGYLKPLIRRSALAGLKYNPDVRVGEDFDFYLRLLLQGLRLILVPLPLYQYRRHSASLSHRLSVGALVPLLAAHDALVGALPAADAELTRALTVRGRMLRRALRYERLVAAIKSGAYGSAAGMIIREPRLIHPLARSFAEGMARRRRRSGPDRKSVIRIALASKERRAVLERMRRSEIDEATLEVPVLSLDRLDVAPDITDLSCLLTNHAARGHIEVIALGLEGLDALGLIPGWRAAEVWLTEQETSEAYPLPADVRLRALHTEVA
jgi:succinoglycan biosynthesis protein ExoO